VGKYNLYVGHWGRGWIFRGRVKKKEEERGGEGGEDCFRRPRGQMRAKTSALCHQGEADISYKGRQPGLKGITSKSGSSGCGKRKVRKRIKKSNGTGSWGGFERGGGDRSGGILGEKKREIGALHLSENIKGKGKHPSSRLKR